ncbi:hypothetical protein [Streptomyces sp. NPDC019224]|uniref:hypothetical protein n=1 Tax=Streptomyces sp. NPDC019224 TaxID=3154484 RepID=UPI0033EB549C
MRVLFVALSVLSIGLLLWTPLIRLAIVRRRALDWWTAVAGLVFVCVLLAVLGRDGSDAEANSTDYMLLSLLLLAMMGAVAHYLTAEIRHYAQLTGKGPVPAHPGPGYGYMTTVPVPTPPYGQPQPQPYPPHPHQQPYPLPLTRCPQPEDVRPAPEPRQHPAPQRIDQVRAELDELSDYLRKGEDR